MLVAVDVVGRLGDVVVVAGFADVVVSGLFPLPPILMSAQARKCSCSPHPTQLVPSGSVPQLLAARYVH